MTTTHSTPAETKPEPKDHIVVTNHKIKLGNKTLSYTATCGTIVLKEEHEKDGEAKGEKPRAILFFVAYTLDGVTALANRPLTFSFNGGPGSSSVWLHLGLAGPKRIAMDEMGQPGAPPYVLTDNEFTLLEKSDLVFIDPVGTGYSRMLDGEKVKEFHDYKRDLDSVGEFIRLYTTRNRRWGSPKYIIGESYGTTRAAGLAGLLQEKYGMYLNGLMLISCALDFQLIRFDTGNDLPPVLYLPTYAATAWYHQCLGAAEQKKPLRALLDEVETFAAGEYATALFKGRTLSQADENRVVEKLSRYTGLNSEYLRATRLRIDIQRFCKELLRSEGKTVGRLDSRFTGIERDSAGEKFEFDPSYAAILGAYSTCFNHYARGDLNFETDRPYHTLASLYMHWGWNDFTNRYVSVSDTLRQAIATNPHLRVFVANGYYDFATPHFASDYSFNHLAINSAQAANIQTHYYEAGHMMYVHQPSLKALAMALRQFIAPRK